ncbi:MAG: translation initiation factor eIF4A [Watsoniomyces obsoletus]|nr:MAG: translation initiation factor eIF4A [Watsoniomyces obsoletus]
MKIAEILSDLTSLRVCGPAEALALVHASRTVSSTSDDVVGMTGEKKDATTGSNIKTDKNNDDDSEVQKIYELMKLHESIKKRGQDNSTDSGLEKARREVERVMRSIRQAD